MILNGHTQPWAPTSRYLGGAAPVAQQPYQPPGPDMMAWARRVIEKVKGLWGTGRWMPWVDDLTEETSEQRSSYRPMLADGVVKSAFLSKVTAVAALEPQVHPAEPLDPREKEAGDGFRRALVKIGPDKIAWSVLSHGVIDGYSICEMVWDKEPERWGKYRGKRFWREIKAKDDVYPETDKYKNLVAVCSRVDSSRFTGPDLADFVHWPHLSFFESAFGMSDFRAAFRPWWIKRQAIEFRQLHLEKYTGPYLRGQYTDQGHKEALATALEEAKQGTYVVVPTGCIIDAIDLSMKGTADYQAALDNCDREILISIYGAYLQTLEGQVSDGRGDTTIHKEIGELLQWYLASQLGRVVSTQMAPSWYEINYADVEPARVTWGSVSEAAMVQRLAVDEGLQRMGLPLSRREAYAYYGRAEPADPDDVLTPPAPPPMFGEGGEQRPPFDLPDDPLPARP